MTIPRTFIAGHTRGWRHRIELREGIETTYAWFLEHQGVLRTRHVAQTA